jgi:hypothetical protein
LSRATRCPVLFSGEVDLVGDVAWQVHQSASGVLQDRGIRAGGFAGGSRFSKEVTHATSAKLIAVTRSCKCNAAILSTIHGMASATTESWLAKSVSLGLHHGPYHTSPIPGSPRRRHAALSGPAACQSNSGGSVNQFTPPPSAGTFACELRAPVAAEESARSGPASTRCAS